jgi:hypothetical protein
MVVFWMSRPDFNARHFARIVGSPLFEPRELQVKRSFERIPTASSMFSNGLSTASACVVDVESGQ